MKNYLATIDWMPGPLPDKKLSVVVLYNPTAEVKRGFPSDDLPDQDEASLQPLVAALQSLGHQVKTLGVSYNNLEALFSVKADIVLNLCEGNGLDGHIGAEVPSLLSARGLPFTGVGAACYLLTSDKTLMKSRLQAAGVLVPRGQVMAEPSAPLDPALSFPLFVKPRNGCASQGIDTKSVVHNEASLREVVERIIKEYDSDAIVEEYIDGREITVGVLGAGYTAKVLPPLEVRFGAAYDGLPKIRMLATKHDPESELYHGFETLCPAPLSTLEHARVVEAAYRSYLAVGGDGYGRVDIRLTPGGAPYVLEVNGNPSLEVGALEDRLEWGMLPLIAHAHGWSFPALLQRLLAAALPRRNHNRIKVSPRWREGDGASLVSLEYLRPGDLIAELREFLKASLGVPQSLAWDEKSSLLLESSLRPLLHSKAPNTAIIPGKDAVLRLYATEEIAPGEALRIDAKTPLLQAIQAPLPQSVRWRHPQPIAAKIQRRRNPKG